MTGKVVAIYTTPESGQPLESVESATLVSGEGLSGDRYFLRAGTFSGRLGDNGDREVTLIEIAEIQRYNRSLSNDLSPAAFRRNIVTSGIRLNDLVGKHFFLGDSQLEGIRLCEPCAYLGSLLGANVVRAMAHRAGLRARIIKGATIRPGDSIGDLNVA